MILIDNINLLKNIFPTILQRLDKMEHELDLSWISVEKTRQDIQTLSVIKDGKRLYFHSRYNPKREAEAIVKEYEQVELCDSTTVLFYGTGLGYHIDAFLKKYPNVNYYIYEPIPELLYTYLSTVSLKELPSTNLRNLILGMDEQEISNAITEIVNKNQGNFIVVELPVHKQVYPDIYEWFITKFNNFIKEKRTSLNVNYAFQKRWIINSMKNFSDVLTTPNILLKKKGRFRGKPALLVAAGPSLNEEIENLRYIKNNGLAYIFSVGSAINTLIYHHIYPDAACTYDPTELNQKVFSKIKEEGITKVPLIFGSSVGYETLIDYPGRKYHMITNQDSVSNYYLQAKGDSNIDIVYDAPSIAVVTMQLLYMLGFNPVILVGQNFAFRGKERHSEGIYYSKEVTEDEREKGIGVQDVYGNDVLTNEGFNRMRNQMESYIHTFTDLKVINTTKAGAHIEGTTFMELDKVIVHYLHESVYDELWLDEISTRYDKAYMKLQTIKMDRAYEEAIKIVHEYNGILNKIQRLLSNQNFIQLEIMYEKLDDVLKGLEKNDFFKTFILPMNRVNYKILADSIDGINAEKNPKEKGSKIIDSFSKFITLCSNDIEMIKPVYEEMQKTIENYCK